MIRRALGVLVVAATFVAFPFATKAASMPWAQADPVLWRWLPHGEDLFAPWRRGLASNAPLGDRERFVLPRNTRVAYDSVHRIVLYNDGCCAYQETVLATVSGPPPKKLPLASLSALRTARGISLGASSSAVRRAYGPARLHRSTVADGLRVLSYYRDRPLPGSSCGWFENFVFRANRLTEIQAGYSC